MKLRLLVAAVVLLAAAPAAQANDPPYPACSPAKPFTWHAGSRIFATSAYVVSLNADATRGVGAGRRRRDVAARRGAPRPARDVDAGPPGAWARATSRSGSGACTPAARAWPSRSGTSP